ncbi:hypothetical protein JG688_00011635 [Phytophthora aleatoria]|uniref:Uncharacterized protein n=1 Tax=Phytophthora aleatoria TaxID=2496075 RepID=A0A8J5IGH6_9STRA|nr:hypothetical protein JG688_00011635 [Phytophthora aleatoria]
MLRLARFDANVTQQGYSSLVWFKKKMCERGCCCELPIISIASMKISGWHCHLGYRCTFEADALI